MIFFYVISTHILDQQVIYPYTELIVFCSSQILAIFNVQTAVKGTLLMSPLVKIEIGTGCNGVEALGIFLAALVAFPAKLVHGLLGLFVGFIGVFLLNEIRILGLFWVGMHYPQHMFVAHTYVGQTFVIIATLALFLVYAEKITRYPKKIL